MTFPQPCVACCQVYKGRVSIETELSRATLSFPCVLSQYIRFRRLGEWRPQVAHTLTLSRKNVGPAAHRFCCVTWRTPPLANIPALCTLMPLLWHSSMSSYPSWSIRFHAPADMMESNVPGGLPEA